MALKVQQITQARLMELLVYDSSSGRFTWRRAMGSRAVGGAPAGSLTAAGYWCIRLDGRLYQAHRLVWLWLHGEWPCYQIDHINGNRLDNRAANLRDIPNRLNRQNMHAARRDSRTGILGVGKYQGRYAARIRVDRKSVFLGTYESQRAAEAAYLAAKSQLHAAAVISSPVDTTDNHLVNLRGQRRVRSDSKVGLQGVQRHHGKWRARHRGRHLGMFNSPEAAHDAFNAAKRGAGE